MAVKLGRNEYPSGHDSSDFDACGPAAVKDGEFDNNYLCDMGCFMQEDVDSNKYYHGAVVQSTKNQKWYFYVEYGRVGAGKPSYQFTECGDKSEAHNTYRKQLKSKNTGRGEWEDHKALGQRLIPKKDKNGKVKDLYLVRPQATRSTGLPCARTIKTAEGNKPKKKATKKSSKKKAPVADANTLSLMRDLNVATISYTKGAMSDDALPTQSAIDTGRSILQESLKRVKKVGNDVEEQVNDTELKQLTRDLYSIIPKKKGRNDAADLWILSQDNINLWDLDLDTFESALYATDLGDETDDPFGGMKITMRHIVKKEEIGAFLNDWAPDATRNVHGHLNGRMKIKNLWFVERAGDVSRLTKAQDEIVKSRKRTKAGDKPLHQPSTRPDLTRDEGKKYVQSNTCMMFHGTRSVNVSGILRESLRLPNQLVGVATNGAMFGPGLYWADDWKKSAGYCSLGNGYYSRGSGTVQGRGAFMFIADVALGKSHIAKGSSGYTKAPDGCHSVFGKMNHTSAWGGTLMNNEFIVYKANQNRLRYLIEFDV